MPEATVLPDVERFVIPSLQRAINPWQDVAVLCSLARLLLRERVDIVHTHSSKAGIVGRLAARLVRVPVAMHTIHGFGVDVGRGPVRSMLRWSERFAATMTDRLVAVSHRTREDGLRMGIGHLRQYVTIPYRIDDAARSCSIDQRRATRRNLNLNGAPTVGMIACLKPQKAPLDFLRVAHQVLQHVPSAQFLLVGDGELRDQIKTDIQRLGLSSRCRLLGWRRDVPELLSAMDVLALSSRWEGLPIAILEAMAAGKPVVAMNVGGVGEAVTDGQTGFVIPPGNLRLMVDRIVSLLQSPEQAVEMGERGRERFHAQFLGAAQMVEQLDALYQEVWHGC